MSTEMVTVKEVGPGSPWQHGITYYPVVFDRNGQDCHADWGKKGEAPIPGEAVEGEFSERNGELKFKKGSADFQNSSPPGTSTSGSQDYPRTKGRSDQQPAIQRQVALKILAPTINSEGLSDGVKKIVRNIEEFISEAGGDPHGADLTQAKVETELDATPVAAGSTTDGSDIPFARPEYGPLFSERERHSNRP